MIPFDGTFENSIKSINCIKEMMMEEIREIHDNEK